MSESEVVPEDAVYVTLEPPASAGGFCCTQAEIQEYFAEGVAQRDGQHHLTRTHWLMHEDELLGCFALQADAVHLTAMAQRNVPVRVAPAVKLARFGRNMACRIRRVRLADGTDKRIGEYMLDIVFAKARVMNQDIAVRYVTLDALPDPKLVRWYESQRFRRTHATVIDPETGRPLDEVNMLFDLHDTRLPDLA